MKKSSKTFQAAAMILAMASMFAGPASASVRHKDAIKQEQKSVKPEAIRNKFGGFSGSGLKAANRFLNQRQYRKRCRQCPHLYQSKKHRSKN